MMTGFRTLAGSYCFRSFGPNTQRRVEGIRKRYGIPALGYLFIDQDKMAVGCCGSRRSDADIAVKTSDRWHLGSCGKAITARVASSLVRDNILRWDTTVSDYLQARVPEHFKAVTLEMLLMHRAGIPNDPSSLGQLWHEAECSLDMVEARRVLSGISAQLSDVNHVGRFRYSNFGYVLAGHVCEVATSQPWENLLRQKVLEPLRITSCGIGAPGAAMDITDPWGHVWRDGVLTPVPPSRKADNPAYMAPAGGMHMSLDDWGRFLVSYEEISEAPPDVIYIREGWAVGDPLGPFKSLWHNGSNTLSCSLVRMLPERGCAFACVANAPKALAENALKEILDLLGQVEDPNT